MSAMELLKLVRRRSFLSEVLYIGLNVVFAIAIAVVMLTTGSIAFAIALVLVSKWRVLAVRTRYWLANVQANLVDFIASLSVVFMLYSVVIADMSDTRKLILTGVLTALYIAWLLVLKPRSTRRAMAAQAAVALFFGVSALYTFSYSWPVSVVVIFMWLIGYAVARHVLSAYDEDRLTLLSLIWGLVIAEIGWVAYHWTVGYALPGLPGLYVPQAAIIILCAGFVALKIYDSFFHHQKIRAQDVLLPVLFSVSVIAVLLVFFGSLGTAI